MKVKKKKKSKFLNYLIIKLFIQETSMVSEGFVSRLTYWSV